MKTQQLRALPDIKEVFKNIEGLSGEIVKQTKSENLSKDDAEQYIDELQDMVDILEDLKKSLKERIDKE